MARCQIATNRAIFTDDDGRLRCCGGVLKAENCSQSVQYSPPCVAYRLTLKSRVGGRSKRSDQPAAVGFMNESSVALHRLMNEILNLNEWNRWRPIARDGGVLNSAFSDFLSGCATRSASTVCSKLLLAKKC